MNNKNWKYHIIPLTQGKVTIIDKDDYETVRKYTWYPAHKSCASKLDDELCILL